MTDNRTTWNDAKPCYATNYTHEHCKYSVNRGWTEDTKFYVPTMRHGTLTAEQVRECVQVVYFEGYSDGSVNRGQHLEETDWQAIADELNARAERTCEVVWRSYSYDTDGGREYDGEYYCSGCDATLPDYIQDAWDSYQAGYCDKPIERCPNCGAKVVGI